MVTMLIVTAVAEMFYLLKFLGGLKAIKKIRWRNFFSFVALMAAILTIVGIISSMEVKYNFVFFYARLLAVQTVAMVFLGIGTKKTSHRDVRIIVILVGIAVASIQMTASIQLADNENIALQCWPSVIGVILCIIEGVVIWLLKIEKYLANKTGDQLNQILQDNHNPPGKIECLFIKRLSFIRWTNVLIVSTSVAAIITMVVCIIVLLH